MNKNTKKLFMDCFEYLGQQALYQSKDKSYAVQILKRQPDKLYGVGEGHFVGKTLTLEVSVFDVLQPVIGDVFVVNGCKYRIHSPPLRDNSGMVWEINAMIMDN
ncbi:head-tail joining protein [Wolbachia endosymbiont of Folsomia candida]|uniref:head-tail joining protein n=1 Tax=Wolbachia endosymbiont of Folsomia candida TaxID=169402 RepID=UPI000B5F558B|nr:hypothetical protein [Wolbachia endosymbiont of Folsomia candida]APR98992.1 hypothetical protein ASM33_07340 [Wolbachia endosymbiont of Folsomia candida]